MYCLEILGLQYSDFISRNGLRIRRRAEKQGVNIKPADPTLGSLLNNTPRTGYILLQLSNFPYMQPAKIQPKQVQGCFLIEINIHIEKN